MQNCDNKSVGILVWRCGKLLLISRKREPFGLAPPAGHVDNHQSFEDAARAELNEEVGLAARKLTLIAEGRKDNPCRRGGRWHYWKVYEAEASGPLRPSAEETHGARWYNVDDIAALATKTAHSDEIHCRLEPIWVEWFIELHII